MCRTSLPRLRIDLRISLNRRNPLLFDFFVCFLHLCFSLSILEGVTVLSVRQSGVTSAINRWLLRMLLTRLYACLECIFCVVAENYPLCCFAMGSGIGSRKCCFCNFCSCNSQGEAALAPRVWLLVPPRDLCVVAVARHRCSGRGWTVTSGVDLRGKRLKDTKTLGGLVCLDVADRPVHRK